ncbi:hypothetical protein GPJ56_007055 [Histomonas meleagridis]|uniref:uncharacterized protein n=1 Tax=Histomonas meleagridis TaxID=135588 RepID=UPI0035599048|nr:hypothetical protein GPJ56_007055 [Histomonas meleagridis]KAH0801710.1 hypothetical protein GO595_005545 [Histomonas meleagridis]
MEMQNKFTSEEEWFERIFGFKEVPQEVPSQIECIEEKDGAILRSKVNNKSFKAGNFQVRNVSSFNYLVFKPRKKGKFNIIKGNGFTSKYYELIDVLENEGLPENDGATYLAASHFNCKHTIPGNKVTNYALIKTQGPYCSLGSGPAIVYFNYFYKHPTGKEGQFTDEVELLSATPITVKHGLPQIHEADSESLEKLNFDWQNPDNYPIGVHRNCQLTMSRNSEGFYLINDSDDRIVHLVFASAFDFYRLVTYNDFTRMISENMLAAEYRGAILAAWENSLLFPGRKGSNKLYLTLLGCGSLSNPPDLIAGAIEKNIDLIIESGLDVYLVCFTKESFKSIKKIIKKYVRKTGGKVISADSKGKKRKPRVDK